MSRETTCAITLGEAKKLYKLVKEAVAFHRGIKDGLADAVIWNNLVPTKKGGNLCLRIVLEEGDYSGEYKSEIELLRNIGIKIMI
ncbi:MAG: hypothetical protein AABW83_04045 [Nanoarchaeota archaeon]